MRVLIVYGTTEGHTRELANFVARQFRERGHAATVEEAGRSPDHPDPTPYDVVFLAALGLLIGMRMKRRLTIHSDINDC